MMSVSKLLSRIVAPDEVLHGDEDQDMIASSLHDHTYGITSDPLTQFSVVLAALVHDCDHSGVSNFQLIKEDAKIASVFKNKSVAEQNSIVLAWDRLMESRFTALRNCIYADPEEMKRFRQLMVNTVLATDIFDKELSALRKARWETAFRPIGDLNDQDKNTPSSREDDVNRKATVVIEHLIQASDVAHTMQHWHIYQKWNERLFAEMTFAYQNGRMDKNPADGWYHGELWYVEFDLIGVVVVVHRIQHLTINSSSSFFFLRLLFLQVLR
jgi:3'5'-cyclic nucleotide phosphodiesterase